MSTYWYLECLDHDPRIVSEDVEQHTNENLDWVREMAKSREAIEERGADSVVAEFAHKTRGTWSEFMIVHAVRFMAQHPRCDLGLVNEYDTREPL